MIWLIGSNGMLGKELAKVFAQNNVQWVGTNSDVDISNPDELENYAASHDSSAGRTGYAASKGKVPGKITWVINCAAYTKVDDAEDNSETAYKVNATGALNIARTARHIGAKLIHISSDYVFDGSGSSPYTEDDKKNPQSAYGKSKAAGDDLIEKEMTQYYILRTSWLYGFEGRNFVYTMTRLMNERDGVTVVNDQKGCPTCTTTLAATIMRIISSSENAHALFGKKAAIPYGIYNCTDLGETTWFDFAKKIYECGRKHKRITTECEISPCASTDFPQKAKRPAYSVLDKTKIQDALHIKLPKWEDSLENFMKADRFNIV